MARLSKIMSVLQSLGDNLFPIFRFEYGITAFAQIDQVDEQLLQAGKADALSGSGHFQGGAPAGAPGLIQAPYTKQEGDALRFF